MISGEHFDNRTKPLPWTSGYCTLVPRTVDTATAAKNQTGWLVQQFETYVQACARQNGRRDAAQDAFMWAIIGGANVLETARAFGMPVAKGAKELWEAHISQEMRALYAALGRRGGKKQHGGRTGPQPDQTGKLSSSSARADATSQAPGIAPPSNPPPPPQSGLVNVDVKPFEPQAPSAPIAIVRASKQGRNRERAAWRVRNVRADAVG